MNVEFSGEKLTFASLLLTVFVALVYVLSTNSVFITVSGFGFNPSKLLVLVAFPPLVFFFKKGSVQLEDLLFLTFVFFVLTKALFFQDEKLASSVSNFVLPFIFYNAIRCHNRRVHLPTLILIILSFSVLHAGLGLVQFTTGDRDLLVVEDINEFKLKYASSYAFNPFDTLLLLPHGLYAYSSVLAIALVFPLFLIAGSSVLFPWPYVAIVFATIASTIFLCFSRFEILSVIFLVGLMTFVIKNGWRVIPWRLLFVGALSIVSIGLYLAITEDAVGSVAARVLTMDLFDLLLNDIESVLWGIPSIFSFLDKYGFNIPHNMYFYLWLAYGFGGAVAFSAYLWVKTIRYISFYKGMRTGMHKSLAAARIYVYVLAFLVFLLVFRAFDYYIVDGYENILLFFFCFLLLDTIIESINRTERG